MKTRWNSLQDAVIRTLEFEEKLAELCEILDLVPFEEEEILLLRDYVALLGPVAKALDFLQGENDNYYGMLIPTLITVSVGLRKFAKKNPNSVFAPIARKLDLSLRTERFASFFDHSPEAHSAVIAAILLPEIKMNWTTSSVINNVFDAKDYHNLVVEAAVKVHLEEKNARETENEENLNKTGDDSSKKRLREDDEEAERIPKKGKFMFDYNDSDSEVEEPRDETLSAIESSVKTSAKAELQQYLSSQDTSFEMLDRFPLLKAASLKFNTPVCSSAPAERLFSFAGDVNAPKRNGLSDTSLEKFTLMKNNRHIDDYSMLIS